MVKKLDGKVEIEDDEPTEEKVDKGAFFFPKITNVSPPPPTLVTVTASGSDDGPTGPVSPSGPENTTKGPDGFFFSKMARERNLQVDELRQSQSGMSYPKMDSKPMIKSKKDSKTSGVIKPAKDKEERFVLTVDGLTQQDLNYLAFMGSYMEDMGYISINHPAMVVKMAIEHLLAAIREEIEEQDGK